MKLETNECNTAASLAQENGYSEIENITDRDLHLISIKNKNCSRKKTRKRWGLIWLRLLCWPTGLARGAC